MKKYCQQVRRNRILTGNVGIGTTTPQAEFIVYPGNVGIGTWTTNSGLQLKQSFAVYRTATSASVTSAGQTIIGVTDTSAARTITLASADTVLGRIIIVKDESGAAGTNHITVQPASGTIDGAASVSILRQLWRSKTLFRRQQLVYVLGRD